MKKKFDVGDLVHINKKLPDCMSHFMCDVDAVVDNYSHNRCQAGNDLEHGYGLFIRGEGGHSWYNNSNMTLIKKNQGELLKQWKDELLTIKKEQSNLDWIFKNGKELLKSTPGYSIEALGKCLNMTNLWGNHGEGITYYTNAMAIINLARPFLETGDKKGWLEFCKRTTKDSPSLTKKVSFGGTGGGE
jgi:hypothetical protein